MRQWQPSSESYNDNLTIIVFFRSRRYQPFMEGDNGDNESLIQRQTITTLFSRYQSFSEGDSDSRVQHLTLTASYRGRLYQSSQKATTTALISGWQWQLNIEVENASLFGRQQWLSYSTRDNDSFLQQSPIIAFFRKRQWQPYSAVDDTSLFTEGDNESLIQRLTITAYFSRSGYQLF